MIEAIQRYIVDNKLGEGDALPTELEFAEQFNVSRGMVREALQYFKTLGIIESRPRRGITIRQLLPDNIFAGYLPFCRTPECRREILQLRAVLEIGMASMLPESGFPEAGTELRKLAEQMGDCSFDGLWNLERKFHEKMFSLFANRFLDCLRPFIIDYFQQVTPNYSADMQREMRKHLQIAEAIESGNAGKLREQLLEHYRECAPHLFPAPPGIDAN